jgi:uncharacterized protein (DUF305 family)
VRVRRLSVVLVLTAAVLSGCGQDRAAPASAGGPAAAAGAASAAPAGGPAAASPGSGARSDGAGAGASVPPNGVDLLFAKMMIVHHDQAVRMSRDLIARPGVPERAFAVAAYIAKDQQREIDEMNDWLQAWGRPRVDPADPALHRLHGGAAAAHGMIDERDVAVIGTAPPAEATRSYLRHMIEHHNGAITMARSALTDGRNAYVRTLSRHIINEQSAENDAMRAMLAEL